MIERQVARTIGPVCMRFLESLFSISINATALRKMTPQVCAVSYRAAAMGKSVNLDSDNEWIWEAQREGTNFDSGCIIQPTPAVSAEVAMFTFTRSYLSTMRTIMEGKQGVVGFDLLSLGDPGMMRVFEEAAEEVFGRSGETLVIYSIINNSSLDPNPEMRAGLWSAYLEHKGIFFEDDWVLGF